MAVSTTSEPRLHPQFVTDKDGKRQSVLLRIEEFNALMETLEDYLDARDAEAAIEAGGEPIPYEQFAAESRQEGLLK